MSTTTVPHAADARRDWLIAGLLAVFSYFVFAPALDCDFVNLDDPDYVTRNPHVQAGLTPAAMRWALTSLDFGNWFPLTWWSLELDASLWQKPDSEEPDPRGFHLTNLLVHSASAGLLYLALRALTGSRWPSVVVAALFAVHPLRVESVAWVAERKDVLSTFFGILTLRGYAAYLRRKTRWRYLAMIAAFVLSLLCKQMMVTLPCLMLVLDWWPLRRAQTPRDWRGLVLEKCPLLALVLVTACATYIAQLRGGGVMPLDTFPLAARFENMPISYCEYLKKTFWPLHLAVFYPHRYYPWGAGLALPVVAGATLLLVAVTAVTVLSARRAPYLLTGWLWYLGTLVPVIGIVQVGDQAYADRYSYFPQIGIWIALCWGVADLARSRPRPALALAAVVALVLAGLTRAQLKVWHDSIALWRHDLAVVGDNPLALTDLGIALDALGKSDEADVHLRKSLELSPKAILPHINRGNLLLHQNRLAEAEAEFRNAYELAPYFPQPITQLSETLLRQGKIAEADHINREALDIAPDLAAAHCTQGLIEAARGATEKAIEEFRAAIRLQPKLAEAHCGLGVLLLGQRKRPEGVAELRQALRCNPQYGEGHLFLAKALDMQSDPDAFRHYEMATECSPNLPVVWIELAKARLRYGRIRDARECATRALQLDPNAAEARMILDRIQRLRADTP